MTTSFSQKEEEDIAPGTTVAADSWVEHGVRYVSTDRLVNVIDFDSAEDAEFHQQFFGGEQVHRQVYALAWQPGSPAEISADEEE